MGVLPSFAFRFFSVVVLTLLATGAAGPVRADETVRPAEEIERAYERMRAGPYKKREILQGPMMGIGGMRPTVTEVVEDRSRNVVEIEAPQLGKIRTETITIGTRRAYRVVAPGLTQMMAKTRQRVTVSAARSIVQQAISVLAAVQTGGLSTQSAISNLVSAAALMKTTADARRALDQAAAAFDEWLPVPERDDDDEDDAMPMIDSSTDLEVVFLGDARVGGRSLRKFQRRPAQDFGMAYEELVFLDAATGLPAIEETSMGGQPMMRTEYFDIGEPITIEVPACLADAGQP